MFLKAEDISFLPIVLTDGDGNKVENCIDIDTNTGNATVFVYFDTPVNWPPDFRFPQLIGNGGSMKAAATFKLPITVTLKGSGIVIGDELQLAAAARFERLANRIDYKARDNKKKIDDGFVNLWAELGMAIAGVS